LRSFNLALEPVLAKGMRRAAIENPSNYRIFEGSLVQHMRVAAGRLYVWYAPAVLTQA